MFFYLMNCSSCCNNFDKLVFIPLYGYVCTSCYQELIKDMK